MCGDEPRLISPQTRDSLPASGSYVAYQDSCGLHSFYIVEDITAQLTANSKMSNIKPKTAPPPTSHVLLSYPADYVLLVTINREKQMNSIPFAGHQEMGQVFDWFDKEDNLRCAIITGAGKKSFCAGQDLIELGRIRSGKSDVNPGLMRHPLSGFAGLSRRAGKKPVIAAVNGFALGGGFEIVLGW